MADIKRVIQNAYQRVTSLYGNYEMDVPPESVFLGNGERLVDVCERVFGQPSAKVYRLGKSDFGERSFKVKCDGNWLKCYECHTVDRARMVQAATRVLQNNGIAIPPILGHDNHVIFAQWIAGTQMGKYSSKKRFHDLMTYQLALHHARLDDTCAPYQRLLYLDSAIERIDRYAPPELDGKERQTIFSLLRKMAPAGLQNRILHSDYKKGNLILNRDGHMVIIDNELLGIGYGHAIDVIYTARMLFRRDPALRDRYIKEYVEKSGDRSIYDHWAFWELCFLAQRVGFDFKGKVFENGMRVWRELAGKTAQLMKTQSMTV
ncbi:MAG: phosphotransferase [Pseudomonadota bacterium]